MFAHTFGLGTAVAHRATLVQQNRTTKVRLLLVLSNIESVRLAKHLPITVPNLITAPVGTVFLELDAEPLVRRSMQAGTETFNYLSRQHLQIGQFAKVGWRENVRNARDNSHSLHFATCVGRISGRGGDKWGSSKWTYSRCGSARGSSFRSLRISSSTPTPSASALNVGTMRLRSPGNARCSTSSKVT